MAIEPLVAASVPGPSLFGRPRPKRLEPVQRTLSTWRREGTARGHIHTMVQLPS